MAWYIPSTAAAPAIASASRRFTPEERPPEPGPGAGLRPPRLHGQNGGDRHGRDHQPVLHSERRHVVVREAHPRHPVRAEERERRREGRPDLHLVEAGPPFDGERGPGGPEHQPPPARGIDQAHARGEEPEREAGQVPRDPPPRRGRRPCAGRRRRWSAPSDPGRETGGSPRRSPAPRRARGGPAPRGGLTRPRRGAPAW